MGDAVAQCPLSSMPIVSQVRALAPTWLWTNAKCTGCTSDTQMLVGCPQQLCSDPLIFSFQKPDKATSTHVQCAGFRGVKKKEKSLQFTLTHTLRVAEVITTTWRLQHPSRRNGHKCFTLSPQQVVSELDKHRFAYFTLQTFCIHS